MTTGPSTAARLTLNPSVSLRLLAFRFPAAHHHQELGLLSSIPTARSQSPSGTDFLAVTLFLIPLPPIPFQPSLRLLVHTALVHTPITHSGVTSPPRVSLNSGNKIFLDQTLALTSSRAWNDSMLSMRSMPLA